jgi:carbon storage regulator CsrA
MEAVTGNLVLSFKTAEGFWIGDNIRVEVVECGHGRTRLMVHAPREIPIDRDVVRERKRREEGGTTGSSFVDRTGGRGPHGSNGHRRAG